MMGPHPWQRGDSLSNLAAANGLADWRRIWRDASNAALRERRGSPENLRVGDIVNIPAPEPGEVASRPVNVAHNFVAAGVPPASLRFIADGGNPANPHPGELQVLHVSTMATPQQLPPGFNQPSTDRRNFKLEVRDLGAGGNTVQVELEVMRPVLDVSGHPERDVDGELTTQSFTPRRLLDVQLRRVPGLPHTFRSRYLRLVVDQADRNSVPDRTVLTDHDPTSLNVEILDQCLTARYTSASGEPLAQTAEVGDAERRFRLKVFLLRRTPGGATVGGLTTDDIRRHVCSWVRRIYAQASLAPMLVDGGVEEVDPVENMVWIRSVSHHGAQGGQEVRFRVNTIPNPTIVRTVTVANESPREIADRLAENARGQLSVLYAVEVLDNPIGYNRARSADILITHIAGTRVVLDFTRSRDDRVGIQVGRVRPDAMHIAAYNWSNVGSADNRALARNYRVRENALAPFVIGNFAPDANANGYASGRQFRVEAAMQGAFPMAGCCFVRANRVSPADHHVQGFSHELGHILADMFHFEGQPAQLMANMPMPFNNHVWAPKRIADRILPYQEPTPIVEHNFPINPMTEIRDRESAQYMEGWDVLLS